jgi:hypothetical protein
VTASGTSTATSVSVSLSVPQLTSQFFVPGMTIDIALTVTQAGVQLINATPGMVTATPPVQGSVVIMTAVRELMGVNQSMFMIGLNTIVQVPLSAGKAGLFTGTFWLLGVTHRMTVDFYAWTPGTLTFTGLTSKLAALPDVVAMGSFALTGMGGGGVTLVSPSRLSIDGSLAQRRTVGFTSLQLNFVPEPGPLLLLAAAATGLALVRGRRDH